MAGEAAALALATLLAAQEVTVDARVGAWIGRLEGDMKFDEKPAAGDRVDFADLGGDHVALPQLHVAIDFGEDRIDARLAWLRERSRGSFDTDTRWNETLFLAGENVSMRFALLDMSITYSPPGGFLLLGARYINVNVELSSSAQGADDDTIGVLAPTAGLRFGYGDEIVKFGYLVQLNLTWLPTQRFDVLGLDVSAELLYAISPAVALSLGFRVDSLEITKHTALERNDLSLALFGLTAGVAVDF